MEAAEGVKNGINGTRQRGRKDVEHCEMGNEHQSRNKTVMEDIPVAGDAVHKYTSRAGCSHHINRVWYRQSR